MAGQGGEDSDDEAGWIETGRHLFAQPCTFLLSVAAIPRLPPADLPEVALVGRSNVGKSSLINALTNHGNLARTSNTPGRTQQINLFDLGGRLILADLPGYGFAKAPKDKVEEWQALIRDYLRGRPSLRLVGLLIDARHGPKEIDQRYMDLLAEAAVAYQVILTKTDLIRKSAHLELLQNLEAALKHKVGAHPVPLSTSTKDGTGIERLRAELAAYAQDAAA
jgi:GTP-binding protein